MLRLTRRRRATKNTVRGLVERAMPDYEYLRERKMRL
jgi:hypothetical protein